MGEPCKVVIRNDSRLDVLLSLLCLSDGVDTEQEWADFAKVEERMKLNKMISHLAPIPLRRVTRIFALLNASGSHLLQTCVGLDDDEKARMKHYESLTESLLTPYLSSIIKVIRECPLGHCGYVLWLLLHYAKVKGLLGAIYNALIVSIDEDYSFSPERIAWGDFLSFIGETKGEMPLRGTLRLLAGIGKRGESLLDLKMLSIKEPTKEAIEQLRKVNQFIHHRALDLLPLGIHPRDLGLVSLIDEKEKPVEGSVTWHLSRGEVERAADLVGWKGLDHIAKSLRNYLESNKNERSKRVAEEIESYLLASDE